MDESVSAMQTGQPPSPVLTVVVDVNEEEDDDDGVVDEEDIEDNFDIPLFFFRNSLKQDLQNK